MTEGLWWPALIGAAPLLWLLVGLGWLKLPAVRAGLIGLGVTVAVAWTGYHMSPDLLFSAALEGILLAFWPILWAIIGAIFTYKVGVATGKIDQIKEMLTGISPDARVQVLVLAWAFSGFLEGAAGYGTAVAIPASILTALGYDPFFAAMVCLVGNTAPTAFGAIGIPVITLAKVTGQSLPVVAEQVALQLTPLILLLPPVLVWLTIRANKNPLTKGLKTGPMIGLVLLMGISYAMVQYLTVRFIGPELPALLGGIAALAVIILYLRLLEGPVPQNVNSAKISFREGLVAWSPYLIVFFLILGTSNLFPIVNNFFAGARTTLQLFPGGKPLVIEWILTPGTLMIIAAIFGGLLQGASFRVLLRVFGETFRQLTGTILTVAAIVALARIMSYSGMTGKIALACAALTGQFFPLISPLLGALGTFLTGSDTSSNVLFGQLQTDTATRLGADPAWLAAANTSGATAGKMISPQNIAIAASATGLQGQEGSLLRKTVGYCLFYSIFLGVLVYFTSL